MTLDQLLASVCFLHKAGVGVTQSIQEAEFYNREVHELFPLALKIQMCDRREPGRLVDGRGEGTLCAELVE